MAYSASLRAERSDFDDILDMVFEEPDYRVAAMTAALFQLLDDRHLSGVLTLLGARITNSSEVYHFRRRLEQQLIHAPVELRESLASDVARSEAAMAAVEIPAAECYLAI